MTAADEVRTYGGWRRTRSLGWGRLDARQTVIVTGCVVAPLLAFAAGARPLAVALAVTGLLAATAAVAQRGGVMVLDAVIARTRWQIADWRGETSYRGGVYAPLPNAWDLPGVLAPLALLDVENPGNGRAGVVWNQRTGMMAATVLLAPPGLLLADRAAADRQVAGWGELLAGLGDDPTVRAAAVTIELTPEPETTLARHVHGRLTPDAPEVARGVLAELAAALPPRTARISTRLTLTVDPALSTDRPRTAEEAAADAVRAVAALSLPAAGADILRVAAPADALRVVRTAFDPSAAAAPTEAFQALDWAEAGPVYAEDRLDCYLHEGAASCSWGLLEAPRQRVTHEVLLPLLSPARHRRRITLCFRTLSRAEAGAVLERELNAAAAREEMRRRTRRDPTARDIADTDRAGHAAAEEAAGAGLAHFTAYVTVTAGSLDELADARREVEHAADRSRLRLRICYGGQAAAFAAGLPVGVHPPTV